MLYLGIGSLLFYGPLSWLPEVYQSRGVDAATAGYLLLVMNFIGMLGSMISPLLAARMRDQRLAVTVVAAITFAGFLGFLLAPNNQAFFWVALMGMGHGSHFGLALLFVVLRSADAGVAARLSSMVQSGGYLIAAAGPFVMGFLHSATGGWTAPIVFLILMTAVGVLVGYASGRNRVIRA
jgi:CP family cyanate transporter-like MFS transporter